MTVQIFQQYQFNDDIELGNTALQWELNNIQQVVNNANAGLITWDNVKVKVLTATVGDVTISTAGSGVVVTTPDGTKTFRIYVDNNGVLNTLELT